MRTKYSFINALIGVGGQILATVLAFLSRMVFIRYLSEAHLGINGLFTNILGILNLAELGIGTTMIYSMYKPAAENDEDKIIRLMNLYRRLYHYVAGVVLLLGLSLFPFLDYFIKGASGVEHLNFIYFMYLANTVGSYFLSYKNSIFLANQKAYIRVSYEQFVHIIYLVLQMIILIVTGNFILFLLVQLLGQFFVNVLVAVRADKDYPYLKRHKELPSKDECRGIVKNVTAMSLHRFGGAIVKGTDNLLMSAFVGLGSVGIYSNYKLILLNLNALLDKVYSAFTGSIGNLSATEGKEKVYEVFLILDFSVFLLYGYFSGGLAILFNPFIKLAFGEKYLFSQVTVLVMVTDFYITGMRQMNLQFRNVMGLFWYDRYKPLAEVLINLVVSITMVKRYGVVGIFIGTIASTLLTCFWIEPYVLMRYGIRNKWKKRLVVYFMQYGIRIFLVVTAGLGAGWCYRVIPYEGIGGFLLKGILYTFIYVAVIVLFYGRSREFRYVLQMGKMILHKLRKI